MPQSARELFRFSIYGNSGSVLFTICGDGTLLLKDAQHMDPLPLKRLAPEEVQKFFDGLAAAGVCDWPSNSDCGAMFCITWSILINHNGLYRRCFGVGGMEPDGWDSFLAHMEELSGRSGIFKGL